MKKYAPVFAATGLFVAGYAQAEAPRALLAPLAAEGTPGVVARAPLVADASVAGVSGTGVKDSVAPSTDTKKVEVTKKKEEGRFSPSFSVWQAWGYQKENPYFGTSIYFSPSFKITDKQTVSAFVGLSAEYTQPDDGRRVFWSNAFLTYAYQLWEPKAGSHKFKVGVGGQVILPTDEGARNRGTMRLALGPLARASWTYGLFTLSARASFLKYLNGSETEELQSSGPATVGGTAVQEPTVNSTGRANPNYQFLSVVGMNLQFTKKLFFDAQIWIINQVPYNVSSKTPELSAPGAQSVTRDSYWAFGEIGYQFTKIFSLGLGFSLSASQLSPGGRSFYLPFNNYNNNFNTYVSATFSPSI